MKTVYRTYGYNAYLNTEIDGIQRELIMMQMRTWAYQLGAVPDPRADQLYPIGRFGLDGLTPYDVVIPSPYPYNNIIPGYRPAGVHLGIAYSYISPSQEVDSKVGHALWNLSCGNLDVIDSLGSADTYDLPDEEYPWGV